MSDEILAIDPDRYKTNADLILAAAQMGYLPEPVLDATYGNGTFWKKWVPGELWSNDIDPLLGTDSHYDFREFPGEWCRSFAATVLDPPYKLDGTPGQGGPAEANMLYGVAAGEREYESVDAVDKLYLDGLAECVRVTRDRGFILVKCMDQVAGMRTRWESWKIAQFMATKHCRYVTTFFLLGHRKQPNGRTQRNPRNNYSQLMVFQRRSA